MAVVITVAQQKGGAGKTTLVTSLAAAWAEHARVALLDVDPQGSLTRWHGLRPARLPTLTLRGGAGWRLAGELDRIASEHDVVLVDTPPQIDTDARRAIRAAAVVLVPMQPSAPDLWAAEGTLALAQAERRPVRLVLNRVSAGPSRLRAALEAEVGRRGLVLLPPLGGRSAFAQAFAQGMGVTEAAPRSLAAAEVRALLASIEGMLR